MSSWKAALTLFFLAPLIGEGLSSSTPLIAFLNPVTFLLLGFLYGGGALLARELSFRWFNKLHWMAIYLFGLAYGIIEEGLFLMSFFNPSWPDLGNLASYGRVGGINTVWAVFLTLFHAQYSICIPIILTHLCYPEESLRPWLSSASFRGLIILFLLDGGVWILHVFTTYPYRPGILEYSLTLVLVIIIGIYVYRKGEQMNLPRSSSRSSSFLLVSSILFSFFFFLFPFLSSHFGVPYFLEIVLHPLLSWLWLSHLARSLTIDGSRLAYPSSFLISIGILSFFFILLLKDPISFIGFTLLFLFLSYVIVRRQRSSREP